MVGSWSYYHAGQVLSIASMRMVIWPWSYQATIRVLDPRKPSESPCTLCRSHSRYAIITCDLGTDQENYQVDDLGKLTKTQTYQTAPGAGPRQYFPLVTDCLPLTLNATDRSFSMTDILNISKLSQPYLKSIVVKNGPKLFASQRPGNSLCLKSCP